MPSHPLQEKLYVTCRKTEIMRLDELGQESSIGGGAIEFSRNQTFQIFSPMAIQILVDCKFCVLAGKDSNDDIDYVQFLPIAAKAIEFMFEPKALKQRAELIEKTDLSSENLLATLGKEGADALAEKFRGLFESCDVNRSGLMNLDEFVLCMKALDFHLSDEELEAYFSSIPAEYTKDEDGALVPEITFEDAVIFLRENIRGMERKKQGRILAASLHGDVSSLEMKEAKVEMEKRLSKLFILGDEDKTGFLTSEEMYRLLSGLELDITEVELDMILAEADRMDGDEDGLIDYKLFLPICVDLLLTYLARKAGTNEDIKHERMAAEQADAIVAASKDEIMQIASYVRTRLIVIDEGVKGESNRFNALNDILHDFHSGLTKTEATAIHDYFLTKAKGSTSPVQEGRGNFAHIQNDGISSPLQRDENELEGIDTPTGTKRSTSQKISYEKIRKVNSPRLRCQ